MIFASWLDVRRGGRAALLALACLAGCVSAPPQSRQRFEFTQPQMGMPFRIVLYAPDAARAAASAEAAFARIAELNAILSDYEDESELTRLSRTSGSGQWVPVSRDLWRVLECGQQIARASDGAFDMTVGPYVQLWRRARRQRELPPPEKLAAARQAVGWRLIELDPVGHRVRLTSPGMRLDLGGIAKGYALQEALAVLKREGTPHALVAGGGDIAAGEPPPGARGWRIEIAPLDVPEAPPPRYVLLRNHALVTSGDLFQRVEINGVRYSHIVDPRTGVGLTDHSLVTLIGSDAMTIDALSKVVSVLGPEKGLRLVTAGRDVDVQIVRKPGEALEFIESPRLRRWLAPPLTVTVKP